MKRSMPQIFILELAIKEFEAILFLYLQLGNERVNDFFPNTYSVAKVSEQM